MNENPITEKKKFYPPPWQVAIGSILIIAGSLILADPYLWPNHLRWLALITSGLLLGGWSLWARYLSSWAISAFLFGVGIAGISYSLVATLPSTFSTWLGVIAVGLTLSGLIIGILTPGFFTRSAGWAFIFTVMSAAIAYVVLITPARVSDFAFLVSIASGIVFIALGVRSHAIGWLIPGGLCLGLGPGMYALLSRINVEPTLSAIGLFLLWFAFGWVLISLSSRIIRSSALWWPLIPDGVLGIAGLSLYIASNPSAAPTLLGNTGSIAIIVFGLYLLLMRRGVQR